MLAFVIFIDLRIINRFEIVEFFFIQVFLYSFFVTFTPTGHKLWSRQRQIKKR